MEMMADYCCFPNVSIYLLMVRTSKKWSNGFVVKMSQKIHSRSHARRAHEAKQKGCHSRYGKRRGAREARLPAKIMWMRRMRILKRLLHKYHDDVGEDCQNLGYTRQQFDVLELNDDRGLACAEPDNTADGGGRCVPSSQEHYSETGPTITNVAMSRISQTVTFHVDAFGTTFCLDTRPAVYWGGRFCRCSSIDFWFFSTTSNLNLSLSLVVVDPTHLLRKFRDIIT
ncbi:hypothetical protein GUJ93_ZPchr0007g4488 [Zizania palustris]|uniref:Large ribosomal subunit protein eL19 domain-containing protein n=1 Tax=Zizania palustris TaxID=103762 RepID=A0A8J5W4Y4_ZIZPA|nr:hypothetical protein GUJ93_ZPchr0007g4488 [Zizania palustris]